MNSSKTQKTKWNEHETAILDTILDGVYEFDREGNLTYANRACRLLFDYGLEQPLEGLNVRQLMAEESLQQSAQQVGALLAGQLETISGEREFVSVKGRRFIGEVHSGPIRRGGEIIGVRGVIRDVTRRKHDEQALRESEQRFRSIFQLSPNAAALTEEDTGILVDVNDRFSQLVGSSRRELIGRSVTELGFYGQREREKFLRELNSKGGVHGLPMMFKARSGAELHARMFARRISVAGRELVLTIFHDETEEKRLEAQFQQAQKMEAVGTLAAGIAHDFNNLLMGIQGYVSLLLMDLPDGSRAGDMLREIEKQVTKGARLTRMLLGFARRGEPQVEPVDVNSLVGETVELFSRARPQLEVRRQFQPDVWPVMADPSQFDQALVNLFVNAWQAMPRGGMLTVSTSNLLVEGNLAAKQGVTPGKYVCVAVQDTGHGIDGSIRERIFDPFFTTRERGVGTGLGLASVYGIVKRHGGFVTVDSEPGRGAVFRLFLPASEKAVESRQPSPPPVTLRRGSGTVLLVDDDVVVRDTCRSWLLRLGYRVLEAGSGREAIDIFRANADDIDLVVLDVVMPGIAGMEVFSTIRSLSPGQKVLFSTGCDVGQELEGLDREANVGVIDKPFRMMELAESVKSLIER